MSILSNLYAGELMSIAKLSNVDRYENMSRKQRENIITTSAAFIQDLLRYVDLRLDPGLDLDLQSDFHPSTYLVLDAQLNFFQLMWMSLWMAKIRPIPENT